MSSLEVPRKETFPKKIYDARIQAFPPGLNAEKLKKKSRTYVTNHIFFSEEPKRVAEAEKWSEFPHQRLE